MGSGVRGMLTKCIIYKIPNVRITCREFLVSWVSHGFHVKEYNNAKSLEKIIGGMEV